MNDKITKNRNLGLIKGLTGIFGIGYAVTAVITIANPSDVDSASTPMTNERCEDNLTPRLTEQKLPFNGATSYDPRSKTCHYKYYKNGEIRIYEWNPNLK